MPLATECSEELLQSPCLLDLSIQNLEGFRICLSGISLGQAFVEIGVQLLHLCDGRLDFRRKRPARGTGARSRRFLEVALFIILCYHLHCEKFLE